MYSYHIIILNTKIVGNGNDHSTAQYFSDLSRRVKTDNARASAIEIHVPKYPNDLVEDINTVHGRNEVSETNLDNSGDEDSVDTEITRNESTSTEEINEITIGVAPIISIIANKIMLAVKISLKSIGFFCKDNHKENRSIL